MRNLDLIDSVITLNEIAKFVLEETCDQNLHDDIRNCANRLHILSLMDSKNSEETNNIIKKAKE